MGEQVDGAVGGEGESAAGLPRALAHVAHGCADIRAPQGAVLERVHGHQAAAVSGDAEQVAAFGDGCVALGHFGVDIGVGADDTQGLGDLAAELQVQALAAGFACGNAVTQGIGGDDVFLVDVEEGEGAAKALVKQLVLDPDFVTDAFFRIEGFAGGI